MKIRYLLLIFFWRGNAPTSICFWFRLYDNFCTSSEISLSFSEYVLTYFRILDLKVLEMWFRQFERQYSNNITCLSKMQNAWWKQNETNTFLRYFPESTWAWWQFSDFLGCPAPLAKMCLKSELWSCFLAVLHFSTTLETCKTFPKNEMYEDFRISGFSVPLPNIYEWFSLFLSIFHFLI